MNIKYLYVITTDQDDLYMEQLHVSLFSLKQRMPDAHVTILSDTISNEARNFKNSPIANYIDELVLVNLDLKLSKKIRSRYLKTNMRNHVTGDFLFIDSDTVISESFNPIEDFTNTLMAVPDGHVPLEEHYIKRCFYEQLEPFKVPLGGNYWNSGVLFVKDNKEARSFFKEWHSNYLYSLANGNSQDQASFYATDKKYNLVTELPAKYNVQILFGLHYLYQAKILHYFSSNKKPFLEFAKNSFLERVRSVGITEDMAQVILNPLSAIVTNTGILYADDLYEHYSAENVERSIYKTDKFTVGNEIALQFYKRIHTNGIVWILSQLNIAILSFEIAMCKLKVTILRILRLIK